MYTLEKIEHYLRRFEPLTFSYRHDALLTNKTAVRVYLVAIVSIYFSFFSALIYGSWLLSIILFALLCVSAVAFIYFSKKSRKAYLSEFEGLITGKYNAFWFYKAYETEMYCVTVLGLDTHKKRKVAAEACYKASCALNSDMFTWANALGIVPILVGLFIEYNTNMLNSFTPEQKTVLKILYIILSLALWISIKEIFKLTGNKSSRLLTAYYILSDLSINSEYQKLKELYEKKKADE